MQKRSIRKTLHLGEKSMERLLLSNMKHKKVDHSKHRTIITPHGWENYSEIEVEELYMMVPIFYLLQTRNHNSRTIDFQPGSEQETQVWESFDAKDRYL